MFVHVAKHYSASAAGTRIVEVVCEKCATNFCYEMSRIGSGHASAHYFIGMDAASNRAERRAHADLANRLKKHRELVPCPSCRWVNEASIRAYRKSIHKGWGILGGAGVVVGGAIVCITLLIASDARPVNRDDILSFCKWAGIIGAIVAILGFGIQFLLRRAINPNATTPSGMPKLPPGTPPAQIMVDGQLQFAPGAAQLPATADWAVYRVGKLELLPLCCQCLAPTHAIFKSLVPENLKLSIPACGNCMRKLRLKFWTLTLFAVPMIFVLAFALSLSIRAIDDIGRVMFTMFVGFVLSVAAVVIINTIMRPFRLGTVSRERGVFRIRFRNPAYTALVARTLAEQDGIVRPGQRVD